MRLSSTVAIALWGAPGGLLTAEGEWDMGASAHTLIEHCNHALAAKSVASCPVRLPDMGDFRKLS